MSKTCILFITLSFSLRQALGICETITSISPATSTPIPIHIPPPADSEILSSKGVCWKPPTLFENNGIYCISFVYEAKWVLEFQVPNCERSVSVVI